MNSLEEIWEKINSAEKILMTLHKGPDGDSLGSCTAMKYVLEKLGKKVTLISRDNVPENFMKFSFASEVKYGKDLGDMNFDDFDLVLFLDAGNTGMITSKIEKWDNEINSVSIDHHDMNDFYAGMNYVDAKAYSVCSILIELFKKFEIEFDKELSTRLLLGVCTDSGFFGYNTADRAMRDAIFLIDKGAEYYDQVVTNVLRSTPLNMVKFQGLVLSNLVCDREKKMGYSIVSMEEIEDLGLNLSETRMSANYLQNIGEFEFVFTLVEHPELIKGSFRSAKGVDVNLIAKELGGGGHKAAAGFILDKMPLEDAKKKVLEAIDKVGINYVEA